MQALARIPKVLQGVEDLRRTKSIQETFQAYKKNVRIFIESVTKEVCQIIEKYQTVLSKLKAQNKKLKADLPSPKMFTRSGIKPVGSEVISPIKRGMNIDTMQTTRSNLFTPFSEVPKLGQMKLSSIIAKRQTNDDFNFPVELIGQEEPEPVRINHSRFESTNKAKKQREQQLRHYLDTGRKNMKTTTERFLEAIGRSTQIDPEVDANEHQVRDDSSVKTGESPMLNQSLGNICSALDTSYVSRKARSLNKRKVEKKGEEERQKKQREQQMTKMLKERGVKSLLQRLRGNVEASGSIAVKPEIITNTSKLMNTGGETSPDKAGRGFKVMINPVPVAVNQNGRSPVRKTSIESPGKPQSILKTSSKILSRSLTGISAIQFD